MTGFLRAFSHRILHIFRGSVGQILRESLYFPIKSQVSWQCARTRYFAVTCDREQSTLDFRVGMAVYLYVRRPALLPGGGHMGNVG
jgi:hypothetical protein